MKAFNQAEWREKLENLEIGKKIKFYNFFEIDKSQDGTFYLEIIDKKQDSIDNILEFLKFFYSKREMLEIDTKHQSKIIAKIFFYKELQELGEEINLSIQDLIFIDISLQLETIDKSIKAASTKKMIENIGGNFVRGLADSIIHKNIPKKYNIPEDKKATVNTDI